MCNTLILIIKIIEEMLLEKMNKYVKHTQNASENQNVQAHTMYLRSQESHLISNQFTKKSIASWTEITRNLMF